MVTNDADIESRRKALKARVQAQIEASREAKIERQAVAAEELVVDESDLNAAIQEANEDFNEHMASMERSNASQLRTLAAHSSLLAASSGWPQAALSSKAILTT